MIPHLDQNYRILSRILNHSSPIFDSRLSILRKNGDVKLVWNTNANRLLLIFFFILSFFPILFNSSLALQTSTYNDIFVLFSSFLNTCLLVQSFIWVVLSFIVLLCLINVQNQFFIALEKFLSILGLLVVSRMRVIEWASKNERVSEWV